MELTDAQWEVLKGLVEPTTPAKRRGRPWKEMRAVLEGVLWILCIGAQRSELLRDKLPPYQTCRRRFQHWVCEGALVEALRLLAEDLLARCANVESACCFIACCESFRGQAAQRAVWADLVAIGPLGFDGLSGIVQGKTSVGSGTPRGTCHGSSRCSRSPWGVPE